MKKFKITGQIIDNESKEIFDYLGINSTSPQDVEQALVEANGEDVKIELNSGGGSVFSGLEIYHLINSYEGEVTIDIIGLAGSIASVIALSGNKVRAYPSSMFMIHNVSVGTIIDSDYKEFEQMAEMLKSANRSIAHTYEVKTKMSEEELLALMDKETWLSSKKALEMGFIDEIINDKDNVLSNKVMSLSNGVGMLSSDAIQNLKNKLFNLTKDDINEVHNDEPIIEVNNKIDIEKVEDLEEVKRAILEDLDLI